MQKTASRELEITLTGKECGLEERAPMCGVPYHAVDNYLNRLVQKGYKVAIAEQMEDPKTAKGLVKREVIRVVTPGTITSSQALEESKNNYLMGIVYMDGVFGISSADISTGDYLVTEVRSERTLLDEIYKFSPSEIICNEAFYMFRNRSGGAEKPSSCGGDCSGKPHFFPTIPAESFCGSISM